MGNRRKIYCIDGKNYLIDTNKRCLYDVDFIGSLTDGVRAFSCLFHNGFREERRYGCVNESFEEILSCEYAYLSVYKKGIYRVSLRNPANPEELSKRHFYYYVDENGFPIHLVEEDGKVKNIVQFKDYKAISEFANIADYDMEGMAISLSYDNKQGVVCSDGSVFLEPKYDVVLLNLNQMHIVLKDGENCKVMLYFEYIDKWEFLPEGYVFLRLDTRNECFYVKYGDNICIYDYYGKQVIPPIYKKLIYDNPFIIATDDNYKMGVLDKNNYLNTYVDFEYNKINKYRCKYRKFRGCYYVVVKGDKQGMFSLGKRKMVLPVVFPADVTLIPDFLDKGFIIFEKSYKKGFLNLDGDIIYSFVGEFLSFSQAGIAMISTGKSWVKLDTQGNVVEKGTIQVLENPYEEEYESSVYTEEDVWDAMTDGMYGDYPGGDIDYEVMGF